jgi:hypothetical protein
LKIKIPGNLEGKEKHKNHLTDVGGGGVLYSLKKQNNLA